MNSDHTDYTDMFMKGSYSVKRYMRPFVSQFIESVKLGDSERVIFYIFKKARVINNGVLCERVNLIALTDMSNLYYSKCLIKDNAIVIDTQDDTKCINDTPLSPMLIRLIQSVRDVIPLETRRVHQTMDYRHAYNNMKEFLMHVIDINKEHHSTSPSETEIKNMNEMVVQMGGAIKELTNALKSKDDEIIQLKLRIEDMKKKLSEIPPDNMCVICNRYTKKCDVLVPCGHTQYCQRCVHIIKRCIVCRADVMQTIKILN